VGSLFRHYSYGLLEEEEEKAGDDEGCFASTQQQVAFPTCQLPNEPCDDASICFRLPTLKI